MNTQHVVPPVILLMGPPGSGKGTQAATIEEAWGFRRIETGALLRSMRNDPSPEAKKVIVIIDSGHLAPPPLVAHLVIQEMQRVLRDGTGIVFDGSPRTLAEAERLLGALHAGKYSRVLVMFLDVQKPETVKRILVRWVCTACRRATPHTGDVIKDCQACGGTLIRRSGRLARSPYEAQGCLA